MPPPSPPRNVFWAYTALVLSFSVLPLQGAPAPFEHIVMPIIDLVAVPRATPADYRPGVMVIRDDVAGTLESTLVELATRKSGRAMIDHLIDSGFVTVLVSERLRAMQAGLWGPMFDRGRVIGATLYIDLVQIKSLDHDPTGVETLAHELRHQIDAARAFLKKGTYKAVYMAASSGDKTRSAQRYGRRVRMQHPDISRAQARQWLEPRLSRVRSDRGVLMAGGSATTANQP